MSFVPDPDFLDGLVDVVAIEIDVNASGDDTTAHGGIERDYQPVSGLEAVPCRISERGAKDIMIGGQPGVVASALILFGQQVSLDARHRIVNQDPDAGTRYWFVQGKSRAKRQHVGADQVPHHWVADAYDRYL